MNVSTEKLFSARGLTKHFDGIRAVDSFSFDVAEGSITGIIGPNGAGKTTVFNVVTGIYRPTSGKVLFRSENITGLRPDRVVRKGIARTFQNIRLFNRRTCLDNVITPLFQRERCSFTGSLLGTPGARRLERDLYERAFELLRALGLERFASMQANNLPYGLQRKLEIARALATEPSLLLLDEPAAGMNPGETRGLANLIAEVREKFRVTILLIEHHMDLVMNICSPIVVMNFGTLLARGTPDEVRSNPDVVAAYLGKGKDLR
ncbi:MAG: ABC transporter ATP-binding protein [Thermovirgaceae bacterium]|jgi:ABC-type branched-subunit amino acid transport system ATPase component|nr:ABC transporter ATP-binding protein [Synergistales bacterium]MDI9391662.1 ABC transporter ATP-binding protein [Synergistota bacterium]MDY0178608.1 ABC transporter ATP-binding protein [Synergistaceae bacterium]HRW86909.1 ABC transporter ATP-binding protein [Thermovirgaceae bacterium]MDD3133853.1 ABC transporter ATP-binding protein [Synergistales bacterium]